MSTQKPNHRIYDRTGGGATEDIYAETLEDAIEAGREWIEDGDWSGCEDSDGDKVYRTIDLPCVVREIVYVPDLSSIEALPGVYDVTMAAPVADIIPEGCVRVQCDETLDASTLPGEVMDASTVDADGCYDVVLRLDHVPMSIDDDATADNDAHDCSGTYSDELPECEACDSPNDDTDDQGHCWVTPHSLVGGIKENPGYWSTGGTSSASVSVCKYCGCYKHESDAGSQRNPDEALSTIVIKPRDDASEKWLRAKHEENGYLPKWLAELLGDEAATQDAAEQAFRDLAVEATDVSHGVFVDCEAAADEVASGELSKSEADEALESLKERLEEAQNEE